MNGFFKKFKRDVTGVVWFASGLFVALALISFRPTDPSFNSTGANLTGHNYCGYMGSFLADLLFQAWGLSAWLIVAAMLRQSLHVFRQKGEGAGWLGPRLIWGLLLMTTVSSLLALYLPGRRFFHQQIMAGGVVGTVVSKGLISAFNFLGVSIILWSIALLLLVFYTERPLQDLFHAPLFLGQALAKRLAGILSGRDWFALDGLRPHPAGGVHDRRSEPSQERRPASERPSQKEDALNGGLKRKSIFNLLPVSLPFKSSPRSEKSGKGSDVEKETGASGAEEIPAPTQRVLKLDDGDQGSVARRKVKLNAKVERRIENWKLPDIHQLEDPPLSRIRVDEREINRKAGILTDKLAQFSVKGEVVHAKPGPAVTMYEFKPNADVKISKITELADDLSLALSSESVRIIAPIPGRDVVGIETSNSQRETVYLKDILANDMFWGESMKLPLCLGRQADGESRVVDLRKMPHLMVAGTTGSGKSVFVVSAITGLLFKHSPKSLRLILIDPKQVDLAAFNNIPHLLMPPIREPKKAVSALKWAIREMDKRYRSMSRFGARGLESYNEIVGKLPKEEIEKHEQTNLEWEQDARKLEQYYFSPQPYIVIVVEEFGDLMAVDKANVENLVVRLAQMARACGMHLVLAMQSPRKDVVTGLIKTNIPGRISFKVASKMDSRIILDDGGAERLLPNGDMLYLSPGVSKAQRHHAPWVTEAEIASVMRFWADQGEPQYDLMAMRALEGSGGGFDLSGPEGGDDDGSGFGDGENEYDERYDEILAYVSQMKVVSASLLQRKFKLGYPRAARMIEIFEKEGVVGPANGSKPRTVLVAAYQDK